MITESEPKGNDRFMFIPFGDRPLFLMSCPYALMKSREIFDTWTAYRWFEKSSFFGRYPNAPIGLIRAVEAWDLGVQSAEAEAWKRMKNR